MAIDRLTRAWIILLGLSVAALVLGNAAEGGAGALGLPGAAGVLLVAALKGREILLHYLELKHAGRFWRVMLFGWLLLIAAAVFAAYAAGQPGWLPHGH